MNRDRYSKSGGFSLIEVVIALMLAGMVLLAAFPLVMTGRNVTERRKRTLEAEMFGDSIFEYVVSKMQNADRIFLGTGRELENLYGSPDVDDWRDIHIEWNSYGLDVEILAELVKDEWMVLSVEVLEEGERLYEREEVVALLNPGLLAGDGIEGEKVRIYMEADRKWPTEGENIWYRPITE